MIEQQRRLSQLAEVERLLAGLPLQARTRATDLVLRPRGAKVEGVARPSFASPLGAPQAVDLSRLPEGWTLEAQADVWVRYDGVCYGGAVTAYDEAKRPYAYRLSPPLCLPERIKDARERAA